MNNKQILPAEAQNALQLQIRERIMGMLPDDKIAELIDDEISSFFGGTKELITGFFNNSDDEPVTLKEEDKYVRREGSEVFVIKRNSQYNSPNEIYTNVYPFRALVWGVIRQVIEPAMSEISVVKIQAALEEALTEVGADVNGDTLKDVMNSAMSAIVTNLAASMAKQMALNVSGEMTKAMSDLLIAKINMETNSNLSPL